MGISGLETDGNPSPLWEICCIFGAILNCHSWLLCCLFWPPTTPKQSTTSLMMFGDVVALSMKEEGHQCGWCTLWQWWPEINDSHICHCQGSSWWTPPCLFYHFRLISWWKMKVLGPSIVASNDKKPQQWQFWRLEQWHWQSLGRQGGFGGPGVNPLWMGTPHKVWNPSLVCGEGFCTIWGKEVVWLATPLWIWWNKKIKCHT